MLKTVLKLLAGLFSLFILAFGGLLIFSTLTDYSPKAGSTEDLAIEGPASQKQVSDTLTLLIWNVGYGGLGAEMDFFNDGGKGTRPDEDLYSKYLSGIKNMVNSQSDSTDFILIQEVDRDSKRSYNVDQVKEIAGTAAGFSYAFALNYDVKFVPVPFGLPYTPYGKTYGGLMSLSKVSPVSATRVQYPGGFSWPTGIYMLDRCALEFRYTTPWGWDLIIVNTHNTAYDATGEIKKVEMEFIKERYEAEVKRGNKVIVGGDWNQVPPSWDSKHFNSQMPNGYTPQAISEDMLPDGFSVWFDPTYATNRSNDKAYNSESTYTTLIDYFITSPGIEVLSVKTINDDFKYSDHQPVRLKVVVHKKEL
ncbi:MAG: endonuclease/exonuclease/phosphatase family protein [Bacteroidia bacterium]